MIKIMRDDEILAEGGPEVLIEFAKKVPVKDVQTRKENPDHPHAFSTVIQFEDPAGPMEMKESPFDGELKERNSSHAIARVFEKEFDGGYDRLMEFFREQASLWGLNEKAVGPRIIFRRV